MNKADVDHKGHEITMTQLSQIQFHDMGQQQIQQKVHCKKHLSFPI